jgi:predicted CoA-binding protein
MRQLSLPGYNSGMAETARQAISDFLAQKRIAVVGASRNPKDFNAILFHDLRLRGYDAVPVNPHAKEIDGVRCYARVQEIEPPVEGVLVMTKPEAADAIVEDCLKAGVRRVWLYGMAGKGAASPRVVELCRRNGIAVVPGFCPYMFLPGTQWFHRLHGAFLKIARKYPA